MNQIVIFVSQYFIILSLIAALIVFVKLTPTNRKIHFLVSLIIGGIVSLLFAYIASKLYSNPRPFVVGHFKPLIPHAAGNGFPSDHTLLASFIGWTILRFNKKYGVIALVLALLIGLARVLAGVHHVEDIIASFIISGITVLLVAIVMKKLRRTEPV